MRCARVKGLLSDYLDGLLDAERAGLVKNHLSKCGKCQKELESLRTLVHELRSLEPLKAPDDFLTSIHSRLEKETFWERIKVFLFIPARIRIPMEWATLAATVVIAFFVFHLVPFTSSEKSLQFQAAKKTEQAPLPAPSASVQKLAEARPDDQAAGPSTTSFDSQPLNKADSATQAVGGKGKSTQKDFRQNEKTVGVMNLPVEAVKRERGAETVPRPAAKPALQAPVAQTKVAEKKSPVYDLKADDSIIAEQEPTAVLKQENIKEEKVNMPGAFYSRVAVDAQPIPLVLHIGAVDDKRATTSSGVSGLLFCLEAPKKEEARPPSVTTKPQTQAKTGKELSKGNAVPANTESLRPAPINIGMNGGIGIEGIRLKIEKLVLALEGKISQTELNQETREPEFLSIEIPIQNFQKFIAKLKEMGTLDVPVEPTVDPTLQTLGIKLQLMIQD